MVHDLQMKPRSPKSDEERIRDFQRKLYLKAKQQKNFRFYVLYDKVREPRFLKEAYKRVKANGKLRPLITVIKQNIQEGKTEILDADLSSYFDTIPHDKLMIIIGKRISDRNVLHLIKMWLKAPIVEDGKPKGGKKNNRGTPQGGVISPLLANIYLNLVDKIVNKVDSIFGYHGIRIVRYAADFVLMGKRIPKRPIEYLKKILERMELSLNEEKTKVLNVWEETFDFLGFTIGYKTGFTKRKYLSITPGKKAEKKFRGNIDKYLKKSLYFNDSQLTKGLNEKIRGWIQYFTIPGVSHTYESRQSLSYYVGIKLEWYYQRKSQRKKRLSNQKAIHYLMKHYGLINMAKAPSVKLANA